MGTQHTTAFLKKRKFLLVLPLLVTPFITLAFWAMGGGSVAPKSMDSTNALNKELPGVNIPEEALDKMSLYNQVQNERDPLDKNGVKDSLGAYPYDQVNSFGYANPYTFGSQDPNEVKVKAKLEELERMINEPIATKYSSNDSMQESLAAKELSNLEALVNGMQGDDAQDPEIQQLNTMLETIMEIQNPELAKQKLKQLSMQQQSRVFAIGRIEKELQAASMSKEVQDKTAAFFTIDDKQNTPDTIFQSTIPAVVHQTQTLVNGAAIKMRLVEPIYVNGQFIAENTFISGICSIQGERLKIEITGLRNGDAIYPVSLVVYDLDAIEGIRIPGTITRDAAKEGVGSAVQSLQLMSLDPSMAAQTAGVGVEAVKGLFTRKAKLIRVTVKAGYPLLLVDLKGNQ